MSTNSERVWLLSTPSHNRLVLAAEQPQPPIGSNYSLTDVTAAVEEFIALNPEWVRKVVPA